MIDELLAEVRATLEDDGEMPGDTDNLIEWGLDSIALMRLAGQWRRNGIEVSFGALAAEPTIARWRELLAAAVPAPAVSLESSAPSAFPLAPLQHAYWIGRQDGQQLGGVAAHLYTEFDGPALDPARLGRAVAAVVRRHPMLRMAVREDGTQSVRPVRDYPPIKLVDFRSGNFAAELEELRQIRSHQQLDIDGGHVFEVGLTLLPDGRSRLHVDVDMVAADARSYRILLADLAHCYANDADLGDPSEYDFARYLVDHQVTTAAATERAAKWWTDRLADQPGAPELPIDQRAADPGRTGRRAKLLSPRQRDRLAEQARKHGVTLAMTLATAYAEVIGGWSAQRRFLLNLPLFDREPLHPEVTGLVGDFTSSVLLDVDLRESAGFAERVRLVQAQLHERAERAAFSGVDVLRELTRARGEQVIAPVVFTSALGLGELFDPAVLREFGEPVWIISQGPQVLLDAQVTELHGGVLVNWDVRENLLRPGVADAMFEAFTGLLDRLAANDSAWSGVVGELLPAGQREVRDRVNDTGAEFTAHCLHEPFFAHARRTPEAPALLWGATGVRSYGELADKALRVAGALWQHGMRPGDAVAVSLPRGPDQVTAIIGVLAAGGTYLPIGRDQPENRLRKIMSTADARLIITDRTLDEYTVLAPEVALDWPDPLPGPEFGAPESVAYLLFTSGSTGEPKGVQVPHRAAVNTIEDLVVRGELGPADRALGVSAMEFDLSVFDVFGLLSVGGSIVVVREGERGEARAWADLVRERGVTVLNCVPALLDMLLVTGDFGSALRLVLLGGDWVGVDLPGRLAAQVPGCRFVGLGGTTETAIHSTWCEVTGEVPADWLAVPYGVPLHNVACRVVDEQGRDCPDWVPGEVWIGGTGVALGYRGDPERTAAKFLVRGGKRWYRTGDLGRYWPDGTLEFLGRADHQVKLRGYRIELGEVEAALAAQPGVRRAVVRLAERRGGSLQALVAGDADEAALRSGLAVLVPAYMVPELIVTCTELPLTRNEKPDRRAIAELLDRHTATTAPTGPGNALERVLLDVWRAILGDDTVGVTDDFLARGGDSVLATRVVAAVREALDTEDIRVRDVFTTRSVTALATQLRTLNPRLVEVAEIAVEIGELSEAELARELG